MAGTFLIASSQRLVNTPAPLTAPPFSIGMWLQPSQVAAAGFPWSIADNATTNNNFAIRQIISTSFNFGAAAGGVPSEAVATITVVVGQWYYLVARAITTANRRIAVYGQDGTVAHGTVSAATVPAGLDAVSIGSVESSTPAFFSGLIGEYWMTATDIQSDGLQLNDATLKQLARYGPFSVPHIAGQLVDYRSLRHDIGSDQDSRPNYFGNNNKRQVWVNTNAVTVGTHPSLLAPQYAGPNDVRRLGVV